MRPPTLTISCNATTNPKDDVRNPKCDYTTASISTVRCYAIVRDTAILSVWHQLCDSTLWIHYVTLLSCNQFHEDALSGDVPLATP